MFSIKSVPSPAMVFSGTMDWLTTVFGIFFFGAVESNPFMAGFTANGLFTFTVVKLSITFVVAFLFHKADKALLTEMNKKNRSFNFSRITLKGAYILSTALLIAAVLNNLTVVLRAI
jgi:Domain of unknown function (DUF5658)